VVCDVEVDDSAARVVENDETVEDLEGERESRLSSLACQFSGAKISCA